MEIAQLHELAKDFLEPLISGAELEGTTVSSNARDSLVALADPCTIHFKAERADPYRLVLRRSQPFAPVRVGAVTESDVVEAFVKVVKAMQHGLTTWYKADLRATFPRRVVAKALCKSKTEEESVLAAMDQMTAWSGQQYEGKAIAAAIGFLPDGGGGGVSFSDMCRERFSAVLSNGFDTLLTCDLTGKVLGHEALSAPASAPTQAPYRLAAVAHWGTLGCRRSLSVDAEPNRRDPCFSRPEIAVRSKGWSVAFPDS
jgi:hypothetical protein